MQYSKQHVATDEACPNRKQGWPPRDHELAHTSQLSLQSSGSTTGSSEISDFANAVNPEVSVVLRLECVTAKALKVTSLPSFCFTHLCLDRQKVRGKLK